MNDRVLIESHRESAVSWKFSWPVQLIAPLSESTDQRILDEMRESRSHVGAVLCMVQLGPSAFEAQDNASCCGWHRE